MCVPDWLAFDSTLNNWLVKVCAVSIAEMSIGWRASASSGYIACSFERSQSDSTDCSNFSEDDTSITLYAGIFRGVNSSMDSSLFCSD